MSDQFSLGPISILGGLLLFCLCIFADHFNVIVPKGQWSAAFRDSAIHGVIAFLSWAVYSDWKYKSEDLLMCFGCALIAMALDADHFILARAFTLKNALSQPGRPPFHATTMIPAVALALHFICRAVSWKTGFTLAAMFTVACLSHHVRDGIRRGLWLPPFGSTPPVPFSIYVLTTISLPLLFRFFRLYLNSVESSVRMDFLKDDVNTLSVVKPQGATLPEVFFEVYFVVMSGNW